MITSRQMYKCPYAAIGALRVIDGQIIDMMKCVTHRDDIYVSMFSDEETSYNFQRFSFHTTKKLGAHGYGRFFQYDNITTISWDNNIGDNGALINRKVSDTELLHAYHTCCDVIRKRYIDPKKLKRFQPACRADKPKGIDITKLVPSDKYRPVVYVPGAGDAENGWISSWNDKFIFVRYNLGDTSAATKPEDLEFIDYN